MTLMGNRVNWCDGYLKQGDLFRVSGGPIFKPSENSKPVRVGLRGVFKFMRVIERYTGDAGQREWYIHARLNGRVVGLFAFGEERSHNIIPGWINRPYIIRPIRQNRQS